MEFRFRKKVPVKDFAHQLGVKPVSIRVPVRSRRKNSPPDILPGFFPLVWPA